MVKCHLIFLVGYFGFYQILEFSPPFSRKTPASYFSKESQKQSYEYLLEGLNKREQVERQKPVYQRSPLRTISVLRGKGYLFDNSRVKHRECSSNVDKNSLSNLRGNIGKSPCSYSQFCSWGLGGHWKAQRTEGTQNAYIQNSLSSCVLVFCNNGRGV